jgi:hypothetical protein
MFRLEKQSQVCVSKFCEVVLYLAELRSFSENVGVLASKQQPLQVNKLQEPLTLIQAETMQQLIHEKRQLY